MSSYPKLLCLVRPHLLPFLCILGVRASHVVQNGVVPYPLNVLILCLSGTVVCPASSWPSCWRGFLLWISSSPLNRNSFSNSSIRGCASVGFNTIFSISTVLVLSCHFLHCGRFTLLKCKGVTGVLVIEDCVNKVYQNLVILFWQLTRI